MTEFELRKFADYLWGGENKVLPVLNQLQQFKRFPEILYWLYRNQIKGKDLIDFFNDAEGQETRGVLRGVKYIYTRIDNDKFNKDALTTKELKR